jgi:hypothetical protein
MFRLLLTSASIAVAASLTLAASGPAAVPESAIVPDLQATVSTRSISLTDKAGTRVRVLYPNTYRVVVKDSTKAQNFHLVGPGVNVRTKVVSKGTSSWRVSLRPGKYVYRSDKSSKLRGSFTVRGAPPA